MDMYHITNNPSLRQVVDNMRFHGVQILTLPGEFHVDGEVSEIKYFCRKIDDKELLYLFPDCDYNDKVSYRYIRYLHNKLQIPIRPVGFGYSL